MIIQIATAKVSRANAMPPEPLIAEDCFRRPKRRKPTIREGISSRAAKIIDTYSVITFSMCRDWHDNALIQGNVHLNSVL